MALISWKNWKESSAATRAKRNVAMGLLPLAAMSSPFGHSSEPPAICDKVKKMVEKDAKKKKKKKRKDEAAPNYSIDSFLNKAELSQRELEDEKRKAAALEADLDKKIKAEDDEEKKEKLEKNKKKLDKPTQDTLQSKEDEKAQNEWIHLCGQLI